MIEKWYQTLDLRWQVNLSVRLKTEWHMLWMENGAWFSSSAKSCLSISVSFSVFLSSFLFCVVFIDLHVKCVWNDQCYYYLAQTLVVKFPWSLRMWSLLSILFDSVLSELGRLVPLAVSSVYFEAKVVSNGDSMLQYSPTLLSLWGSLFQCSKLKTSCEVYWGGGGRKNTHACKFFTSQWK